MKELPAVVIIGAGLAGCEAALQLARRGIPVQLCEMKPGRRTPAQTTDGLAELVCSNSFRSGSMENAVGVIKEELRRTGGALIELADRARVPAGDALAVDRTRFSELVGQAVRSQPLIELVEREVTELPGPELSPDVVIATGPLTSDALARDLACILGDSARLYFYDAIAPIVSADSIDHQIAFRASRYGKGSGDEYLNCPLNREEYEAFVRALLAAEKVTPRNFEEPRYFEGCLPIEVLAERGQETLRYGCMKPVGLDDPRTGRYPFAVVQLRPENRDHTAYNLVGFQTRMKWPEQSRVLRMIPGLKEAEILRFGQIHRNTYLDSPSLLDGELRLKARPHLVFAGQITGVEGYVESMASGFLVGLMIAARRRGRVLTPPPPTTTLGALLGHTLGLAQSAEQRGSQHLPSNIHWGLLPPLPGKAQKRERKRLYGERALAELATWWAAEGAALAA